MLSLIYKSSPAEVRFVLVDLKMVDLMPYEGIQHLLMPEDAADIIREGRELKDCVGSAGYIEAMANNKCRILFLRKNTALSKALITTEERNSNIRQCYGYRDSYNRNEKIRDFITEYAKKRGLGITAEIYKQE